MNEKFEHEELDESILKNVSGGVRSEIVLDPAEIARIQAECWDLHNHEYDPVRCEACTRLGDMSKSICKVMLTGHY